MAIEVKFVKQNLNKNILIFIDENFRVNGLEDYFSKKKISEIKKNIINFKLTKPKQKFTIFNIDSNQKIIVLKILNNLLV
jgi:hypothetical protein